MSDGNGKGTNEFGIVGSGRDQLDALQLFAYSRAIPGAPKPALKLPGDNVPVGGFAKAFWSLVRERGVFRRDVHVVLINEEEKRLDFMEPHMLMVWADEVIECFKDRVGTNAEGESETRRVKRSMPVDVTRALLAEIKVAPGLICEVEKINYAPMPVFRRDGKIELLTTGYDIESKTFTFDCGFKLDEEMTLEAAHEYLVDRMKEFPFGDGIDDPKRSLAVQVACMLTLYAGGLLPREAARPMFVFNANAQRSGKSLLAKMALLSVFGSCARSSWSENKEEFRKALETAANTAAPYIFFDNVRGHMANADLEGFVTSPDVTCRVMGKNTEQITVPNVATVLVTGNQATTSEDIAERSLFVNLFVNEADPQARKITAPIDEPFLKSAENRRMMLSALWSLVRHWDRGGRFLNPTRLVGFEKWSECIGGIVQSGGFVDPLQRPQIAGVGGVVGQKMKELVMRMLTENLKTEEGEPLCEIVEGGRAFTFTQLARVCATHGLFEDFVPDDGDMKPKDRSSFGKFLKRYIGRGRVFTMTISDAVKRVELKDNGQSGRAKRFLVAEVEVQ